MKNVLVGRFEDGIMKEARHSKIIAERCHMGVKEIKVGEPKSDSPTFKHTPLSTVRIGSQPTVMDPFEQGNVYIREGTFGDGVFAKKNLSEGDIILYYSGLLHNKTEGDFFAKNLTEQEM